MSFNLVTMACGYQDGLVSTDAIRRLGPAAVYLLGDLPGYFAKTFTMHGVAVPGVTYTSVAADFQAHVDSYMRMNEMRRLWALRASGMKAYWHPDDHGWGGDNWDHTINRAQQNDPIGGSVGGVPSASEVLTHWRAGTAGHAASVATYFDNPPFGAGGDGYIPTAAQATPGVTAADFPVRYFHVDYAADGSVGGRVVRALFLDCISGKNSLTDTDNASKYMLSPQQEAWLLARVQEARAQNFAQIVVMSTKDLFNLDNSDGWFRYSTQRDRILAAIHALNAPVVWMTGDRHTPHVGIATVAAGDAYDCLCLCPTSASTALDPMTAYKQNVWQAGENGTHVFGAAVFDTAANVAVYSVRDIYDGSVLFSAAVPFGARLPAGYSVATPRRIN